MRRGTEGLVQSPARAAVLVVVGLAAITRVDLPAQQARSQADADAVRAMVARYMDARERRDPALIGALFTDDVDQFTSGGEWRRGRDAVVKGTLASSENAPGARRIEVRAVRFLHQDVAIADGVYEIGDTSGGSARRLWTTIVMRHTADGWRISAIRNASPASIPD